MFFSSASSSVSYRLPSRNLLARSFGLFCPALVLVFAGGSSLAAATPSAGAAPAGSVAESPANSANSRVVLPADTVPPGTTAVTVRLPAGDPRRGFELAHQLEHAAEMGRAELRRNVWNEVADAVNSVPLTGPDAAERRQVGKHQLLIRKLDGGNQTVLATLFLPVELLTTQDGNWTLAFDSNPGRTKSSATQVTTVPLRASLAYADQPAENRSVEGKLSLARTYISRATREAVRDENGDLVRFDQADAETIQDSLAASFDLGYLWTVGRATKLGQVELGTSFGGAYESDELNLLDQRTTGYLGLDLRLSSETADQLWGSFSLRLGGSDERYLILDPIYDAAGEPIGTTTTIERHELPHWEVVVAGSAPLYSLNGFTLVRLEASASYLRSLEASNGGSDRPETTEQRARLTLGLSIELPMGARVGLAAELQTLDLPGEAGQRVDDVQWTSGMTAGMTVRF